MSVWYAQPEGWYQDRYKRIHQKYVTVFDRLCAGMRLRSENCFGRKLLEGGYLNYRLPVKFVFGGIFKRISAIEAEDLLDAVKYRQEVRKDRSDGENTPEIRGEKIGDQN